MAEFFSGVKDDFIQSFVEGDRWLLYLKGIGVTLQVAAIALVLGIILEYVLKIKMDIPCCKDVYYESYRRFFWILNKMRD